MNDPRDARIKELENAIRRITAHYSIGAVTFTTAHAADRFAELHDLVHPLPTLRQATADFLYDWDRRKETEKGQSIIFEKIALLRAALEREKES